MIPQDPVSKKREDRLTAKEWLMVVLLWGLATALRYGLWGIFLVLTIHRQAYGQAQGDQRKVYVQHEELRYQVRWSMFRLGTLTVRQGPSSEDSTLQWVSLTAESDPRLPFVNVWFVNEAHILPLDHLSRTFVSTVGRGGEYRSTHRADTVAGAYILDEYIDNRQTRADTLRSDQAVYDDPSLFMYIRNHAGSDERTVVRSVMEFQLVETDMYFPAATEHVSVPAFDRPVEAYRFVGNAHWERKAYAGLKGEFVGWVSADEVAVVLRAELKIVVGTVVLELESMTRILGVPVRFPSVGPGSTVTSN